MAGSNTITITAVILPANPAFPQTGDADLTCTGVINGTATVTVSVDINRLIGLTSGQAQNVIALFLCLQNQLQLELKSLEGTVNL